MSLIKYTFKVWIFSKIMINLTGFSIPESFVRGEKPIQFRTIRAMNKDKLEEIRRKEVRLRQQLRERFISDKYSPTRISILEKPTKRFHQNELFISSEKKKIVRRALDLKAKTIKFSRPSTSPNNEGLLLQTCALVQSKNTHSDDKLSINLPLFFSTPQLPKINNTLENWKICNGIPKDSKIFIINGNYPVLREAFLQRGWAENTDPESMHFDIKWARNPRVPADIRDWQMINHFPRNIELAAKWNFCENIKKLPKNTKFNPLKFFPRCFKIGSKENEEFYEHYKALKALGILKSYVEGKEDYCYEKILVSSRVCQRWAFDIEKNPTGERAKPLSLVLTIEWRILNSNNQNEMASELSKLHLQSIPSAQDLPSYAASSLSAIKNADPQFYINGKRDIWIVKPGRKSRGRGIALFDNIDQIRQYTSGSKYWVIQKYIENPLIIQKKKFDIRQWVLISNSDPLTVWIYQDCYLRFAVDDYQLDRLENKYMHLTNNSIVKNSDNFEDAEIVGCMWHINQLKEYFEENWQRNVWQDEIFPKIRKIVKMSLMSVGNLGRRQSSFEIFGYDLMIDENLQPWLIEINSSPAMDYSTPVTEVLVKEVLRDAVKVVIDHAADDSCDTGKFVLCYKARSRIK
ncbi:unnamed protein product [Blepharisma stoltei]|uniref:Uncharacterized protein n=1 Tax=Blepharisma stoltei TaxID=1481888 RepID=A0AAU9IQG0_9CILI|nr:unnamed protein product [Blepharisma stoltei]